MLRHRHIGRLRLGHGEFRPRTPRQLTTRAYRAAHRLGDRVEWNREHVVQDKRHPLAGTEPAQHLQERRTDFVVQSDPISRVHPTRLVERGHLWVDVAGALVAGARRTHLIEAEPASHHGQPGADILDLVEVGA
jgi:hypothetical protein